MRALNRHRVPSPGCLGALQHGRDRWEDVEPQCKQAIWDSLDAMQARRCAYCEGDLDRLGCHVEHLWKKGRHPERTFVWTNLFGSCKRDDSCGCFKDNHAGEHDPRDLIDPGQEDPDHFLFIDRSGRVLPRHGITEDDRRRANETIRVLNLNLDHRGLQARSLCAERRRVLETYLQPQPDLLEALESLTDDERRSFIATEVATESNRPFGSIVRHFFEGMW